MCSEKRKAMTDAMRKVTKQSVNRTQLEDLFKAIFAFADVRFLEGVNHMGTKLTAHLLLEASESEGTSS
jgi:hypothetical protein